ncbi:MAG: diacylglycerol kinase family protein [Patescibacteria group bacterium]
MTGFTKYYFIINPAAGNGRQMYDVGRIQEYCREQRWTFDTVVTKAPGEAVELARRANGQYEVVVAVGGDGTVNEVATGILGSNAVLGIIPTGSGNDFALTIGLTKNIHKNLKVLNNAGTRTIDIGRVNGDRYFINGIGVGFDGEVASRVRKFLKYARGFSAYVLAVLRTLITYRFRVVRISIDGHEVYHGSLFFVATCNGTRYGGGFRVAPMAKIDDGHFDICLVKKTGRWYALRHLPKFTRGKHLSMPEVHMLTGHDIVIESAEGLAAHVDGELLPRQNHYRITIVPKSITIISP